MMAPFNQQEGQLVTTLSLSPTPPPPKPHNKHTHCCNHCEYQIWTSNHALIMSCEISHKLYLILAIALRHGYWCHNFPLSKCECNHNITNWNWSKHYSMFYGIHVVWQLISPLQVVDYFIFKNTILLKYIQSLYMKGCWVKPFFWSQVGQSGWMNIKKLSNPTLLGIFNWSIVVCFLRFHRLT
jgi:hypothetical protein